MTLLDDYEAPYKLRGITIISRMLKTVHPDLLRRTGVDDLIFSVCLQSCALFQGVEANPARRKSLKGTLVFLHNPKTPEMLSSAIPTIVELVDLLLPAGALNKAGGKQRFDRLCSVLGDGIIGSIWTHASRDLATIRATIDQVPLLVESLGVCAVRYLKVNHLHPSPRILFVNRDLLSHWSSSFSILSTLQLLGYNERHLKRLTN